MNSDPFEGSTNFDVWRDLLDEGRAEEAGELLAGLGAEERAEVLAKNAEFERIEGLAKNGPQFARGDVQFGCRLVDRIGDGATVVVWKAQPLEGGEPVALKFLRYSLSRDPHDADRFLASLGAQGRIDHPNVERVLDRHSEGYKLAGRTQLVDRARTLDVWIGQRRLALMPTGSALAFYREVAGMVAKVADGLATAHAEGLIHRDVKPNNILVDREDEPLVVDFGAAHDDRGAARTVMGQWFGTPHYMSPEAIAGGRLGLDTRSDIFSLGICLYEALVGELPFPKANPVELSRLHVWATPVDPRGPAPGVDEDLARIVIHATRPDPQDRYASAAEFRDDLLRYLAGDAVARRTPGLRRTAKRVLGRRSGKLKAAAVIAAVLGATGVGAVWNRATEAGPGVVKESFRPAEGLLQARFSIGRGDEATARRVLEGFPAAERGWVWRHLGLSVRDEGVSEASFEGPIRALAVDADDGSVAVLDGQGQRWRWDRESGVTARAAGPGHADAVHLRWDARAREVVALDRHFRIVNEAEEYEPRTPDERIARLAAGLSSDPDWIDAVGWLREPAALSPGGGRLAGWTSSRRVRVVELELSDAPPLEFALEERYDYLTGMSWSPDGSMLLVTGVGQQVGAWIAIYSAEDGTRITGASALEGIHAWGALGEGAAFVREDGSPGLLDAVRGGAPVGALKVDEPITALALQPGESKLIVGSTGGSVRVLSLDPDVPDELAFHGPAVQSSRVVLGGVDGVLHAAVGMKSGAVRLWSTRTGEPSVTLRGHRGHVTGLDFGCGDRLLATASPDGSAVIWDVEQRQVISRVDLGRWAPVQLDAHPSRPLVVVVDRRRELGLLHPSGVGSEWELVELAPGADSAAIDPFREQLLLVRDGVLSAVDLDSALARFDPATVYSVADASLGQDSSCTAVRLSPDGTLLATGHADGALRLWPLDPPRTPDSLPGERRRVAELCFVDGGDRLMSVDREGRTAVFDVQTTELLDTLHSGSSIVSLAFDARADRLFTLESSGALATLEAGPSFARTLAESLAGWTALAPRIDAWFATEHTLDNVLERIRIAPEFAGDPSGRARAERWARGLGDPAPHEIDASVMALATHPGAERDALRTAEAAIRSAIDRSPPEPFILRNLALVQIRLSESRAALDNLRASDTLELEGPLQRSRAGVWSLMAMAHHQLDDRQSALAAIERADELAEAHHTLYEELLWQREARALVFGEAQD